MAEYHIGLGAFAIYAGELNRDKTIWLKKSNVTDEAIRTVAEFLLQEENFNRYQYKIRGKKYEIKIVEVEE